MAVLLNILVQGVLLGGLYALFAAGLSLVFGVMRLVNLAHGDFIVLAAYLALSLLQVSGLTSLESLLLVVPAMAILGYVLQRGLLNFTLKGGDLTPLLVTFGLSIIIQNVLLELFSADSRKLPGGAFQTASVRLSPSLAVGLYPLAVFLVAVGVIAGLQLMLYRTRTGRIFRAAADDRDTLRLMGVDTAHVNGLAMALAMGVVGLAGVLFAIQTNFDPAIGPARLLYAFEAVIMGGLGSPWGTLAGGVTLGLAQTFGAAINPGIQILAGHVVFLVVLLIRPCGLIPGRAFR